MDKLLTLAEFAARFRIHPETARRNARRLGAVKIGAVWRFPEDPKQVGPAPAEPARKRVADAEVARAVSVDYARALGLAEVGAPRRRAVRR